MTRKRITQKDVAAHAEVSTGTVSRAINDHPWVSSEAKERVEKAIIELGYVADVSARSLAKGRTNNVMFLLLNEETILPTTWSYELPIIQGVLDDFKDSGMHLQILMHTVEEARAPGFFPELISNRPVDAIVILSAWNLEDHSISELRRIRIPHVFIGNGPYPRSRDSSVAEGCVVFDNSTVIFGVVERLFALGHRLIAFIKGSAGQAHADMRYAAFVRVEQEKGLDLPDELVVDGDYSVRAGYEGLLRLWGLDRKPSAVVCANDYMAIGVMKAAMELGLAVPEDLSVVGFDDADVSAYLPVPLSTVRVPLLEIGSRAAERIHELLTLGVSEPTDTLASEYVERASVGTYRPGYRGTAIQNRPGLIRLRP